ncbi:MAG: type I methionyl aminopeptidase [Lachnospiraceae bacterium]|nr:type I methionyl aminopeptidase [Lachnospiraceae bacterium]
MMITIKDENAIALMRESNRLLGIVHDELAEAIRPGISTAQIDELGESLIRKLGGVPNFKNYNGYPASICVSVNDEVVHGIPRKDRILKEGDIVSLDAGLIWKGYHSDAARTHGVGSISPEAERLIRDTRNSFFAGIAKAVAGAHLHQISAAIDDYLTDRGYGIVRDLTGHGIGTALHEDPVIPNYRRRMPGPKLKAGMTLAVEPMVTLGRGDVDWLEDDWTVVTADGSWAAHYENTILITPQGRAEILSLGERERQIGIPEF